MENIILSVLFFKLYYYFLTVLFYTMETSIDFCIQGGVLEEISHKY